MSADIQTLQVLVGIEPDEAPEEAERRARIEWENQRLAAAAVKLADPIAETSAVDPELNEGYQQVVNVCGNVLVCP